MRRDQMSRIPAQRLSASNPLQFSTRRRATVAAMGANEYARAEMMERERCWFNECLQLVAELARTVFLRLVVAWRGSEKQWRCWGKAGSGQNLADPCGLHQKTCRQISLTGQEGLPLAR